MNFNISETKNIIKSTGVKAGVHNAKFVSVSKNTRDRKDNSGTFNVMTLTVDIEGVGEYSNDFYEPTSNERSEGMYGTNPSQLDHFLVIVNQILSAIAPEEFKKIMNNEAVTIGEHTFKLEGSFDKIVNGIALITSQYQGKEIQVKLLPNTKGFVCMDNYPAKISKNNNLVSKSDFIGKSLSLTAYELKKIKASTEAKPTSMASISTDLGTDFDLNKRSSMVASMADGFDDLPNF